MLNLHAMLFSIRIYSVKPSVYTLIKFYAFPIGGGPLNLCNDR